VQRTDGGHDVHGGDVPNAGAYRLGLNMQVRLSRVSGVSHFGNLLAELDMITDLDLDTAGSEMCHQYVSSAANVDDDVIAALIVAISRSFLSG